MRARQIKNLSNLMIIYREKIVPTVGENHLDYGCGTGQGTRLAAADRPNSIFVGYDSDPEKIAIASRIQRPGTNTSFIQDPTHLRNRRFNSANASFVYHENPEIIEDIRALLVPEGILTILDYNLKGIPLRQFRKVFCSDNERRVLRKEGEAECYRKHTALGPEDCIASAESSGFKTTALAKSGNYYVWTGQKQQVSQF